METNHPRKMQDLFTMEQTEPMGNIVFPSLIPAIISDLKANDTVDHIHPTLQLNKRQRLDSMQSQYRKMKKSNSRVVNTASDEDMSEDEPQELLSLEEVYREKTETILNKTIRKIVTGEATGRLPASLAYLQTLVNFVASTQDRRYILSIFAQIREIFENEYLPIVKNQILECEEDTDDTMDGAGGPLDIFVRNFDIWNSRIQKLRVVFMALDNSTTLRLGNRNNDDKEWKLSSFAFVIFAEHLLDSVREEDINVYLFDYSESEVRNKVLMNFGDLLMKLLVNEADGQDCSQLHDLLYRFVDVATIIEENQRSVDGIPKLKLFRILREYLMRIGLDAVEEWPLDPLNYLTKCQKYSIRMNSFLKHFSKLDKTANDIGDEMMFPLMGGNSIREDSDLWKVIFCNGLSLKPELRFLYEFYVRFKNFKVEALSKIFSKVVIGEVREKVENHLNLDVDPKSTVLIQEIVDYKKTTDELVADCFDNAQAFKKVAVAGFVKGIAKVKNGPTLICDKLLRFIDIYVTKFKPTKRSSSVSTSSGSVSNSYTPLTLNFTNPSVKKKSHLLSEADGFLDTLTSVLSMVPDKRQYFFDKYQIQLSMRLLRGNSVLPLSVGSSSTLQLEMKILDSLTKVFGKDYTDQLEYMVLDVSSSNEVLQEFVQYYKPNGNNNVTKSVIDSSVCCVNPEHWPKPPENRKLKIPHHLKGIVAAYESFYKGKHPSRQIEWRLHFQRVTIDVLFDETDDSSLKSVDCSIYQAVVLLAFDDGRDILGISQLLQITGMQKDFMMDVLKSLTAGKFELLIKDANNNYQINSGFKSSKKSVKLSLQVSDDSSTSSLKPGLGRNFEEMLTLRIEAFVSRLLKSESSMKHDELMIKILDYTKENKIKLSDAVEGIASGSMNVQQYLKGIIEGLISNGYLRRSLNSDGYDYIP